MTHLLFILGFQSIFAASARFSSSRNAALADSSVAFCEDSLDVFFCNPAYISKFRRMETTPVNIQLTASKPLLSGLTQSFNVFDTQQISQNVARMKPQYNHLQGSFSSAVLFSRIGFGVLLQAEQLAVNTADTVYAQSNVQFIPTLSLGHRFLGGYLKLGYALQWVHQLESIGNTNLGEPVQFGPSSKSGSALSHNAAIGITLPIKYRPTFHAVLRDILNTEYKSGFLLQPSSQYPDTQNFSIDIAAGMQANFGQGVKLSTMGIVNDFKNFLYDHSLDKIGLGAELEFSKKLFLRVGFRAQKISFGVSLSNRGTYISFSSFYKKAYSSSLTQQFMLQYEMRN